MKEKISVLMSVYNAEKYLKYCIDSVLNQSYSNFLFYIVNDCCSDDSINIIKSYADNRIKLIENEINIGLTKSLNKAISQIHTKYIARIDADDVCEPDRLLMQLAFLEENDKKFVMLGSSAYLINESNNQIGEIIVSDINLKEELFFKNTFIHSSIMIKTEVLKKYKYDEQIEYAQDYNLWLRISQNNEIANIKEKLIRYRNHGDSISVLKKQKQDDCVLPSISNQLKHVGIPISVARNKFAKLHLQYFVLGNDIFKFKDRFLLLIYLKLILKINKKKEIYNEYFNKKLSELIKKENEIVIYNLKRFIIKKFKLVKRV